MVTPSLKYTKETTTLSEDRSPFETKIKTKTKTKQDKTRQDKTKQPKKQNKNTATTTAKTSMHYSWYKGVL